MVSYGLPLLGFLALAVLWLARSWLPAAGRRRLGAGGGAGVRWPRLRVVGGLPGPPRPLLGRARRAAAGGVLDVGQPGGAAAVAPVRCSAPALGRLVELRGRADRVVAWLVAGAGAAVLTADLSRMSKAEVERIWLPFVPWLLLSTALLPERWRRPGLLVQVVAALLLQHLLFTSW